MLLSMRRNTVDFQTNLCFIGIRIAAIPEQWACTVQIYEYKCNIICSFIQTHNYNETINKIHMIIDQYSIWPVQQSVEQFNDRPQQPRNVPLIKCCFYVFYYYYLFVCVYLQYLNKYYDKLRKRDWQILLILVHIYVLVLDVIHRLSIGRLIKVIWLAFRLK